MPRENQGDITFEGLVRYLHSIDFAVVQEDDHHVALRHSQSGTLILLTKPEDGSTVAPADLLSVEVRLRYGGLADNAALERFRSGKLPLAG